MTKSAPLLPQIILLLPLMGFHPDVAAAGNPRSLNNALGLSDQGEGFSLDMEHRSRFENISDNVQAGASDNDQVLVMRTTLGASYESNNGFTARFEVADMRQELADEDSFLKGRTVNVTDILEANIGYRFGAEDNTWLRLGRFTDDWGSRRLMARNRFRNTISAFDGLLLHHEGADGAYTRFMATQVVRRLPGDFASMLDNEYEADESSGAQRFYGVHTTLPNLFDGLSTEAYYYALREKDSGGVATANRNFDTVGFRLLRPSAPGEFEFEAETIYQFGKRRATAAPTDTRDLDYRALFQYLMVGYGFDAPSNLRLLFEFNYISGDEDPFDRDHERFDSLFGPTTAEFGVFGLYDPFNRTNLITPGLRLFADLRQDLDLMVSYRHFWLAETRDTWGRTGLRDVSGGSGRYLGQHLALRLRWDLAPGNVRIQSGAIYFKASNLSDKQSKYFYTSVTFTF